MISFAKCDHPESKKFGTTPKGAQRYRCLDCGKTFTRETTLLDGMRIGRDKAEKILAMLTECVSVRATSRLTDTDPHTIIDLLLTVGERCKAFLKSKIAAQPVDDVQVDELWQFIFCKQKTAKLHGSEGGPIGDSYCFTAIERNTKLLVTWHLGHRTYEDTQVFCRKLRDATTGRFQVSTDGYGPYLKAIPQWLGDTVDYGRVIKVFGDNPKVENRQYSPGRIMGMTKEAVWGKPDEDKICTSHTERLNGSIRNFTKRMGRLTYCFSKKWECHEAALALGFAAYNFCKKHRSLKGQTPAMAAGLTDHVWTIGELLENVSNI